MHANTFQGTCLRALGLGVQLLVPNLSWRWEFKDAAGTNGLVSWDAPLARLATNLAPQAANAKDRRKN
eukprot:1566474-Amphidinium_carterae.1